MTKKLLEPLQIRSMRLKNRLGFAPFLNNPVGENGAVSDVTIRWFEERAKGGVGLVMTGATRAGHLADGLPRGGPGLSLNDDRFIPGFTRLAEAIHSHGACIGVQIAQLGPLVGFGVSPLPYPDKANPLDRTADVNGQPAPIRVLTTEELDQIPFDIAAAAARAKAAGIDCVELHCAHGGATVHCTSISPFYNRRDDKYGGSPGNRMRLASDTVRRIREAVGNDYPIIVRIDADELLGERGITVEYAVETIVPALEAAGADCFDVTQGSILHTPEGITIPLYYPRGCYIHNAAAIKGATQRPVIGVGNIFDLDMAEKFLVEGKADIIYLGRLVTSDPEAPKKYFDGRPEDIRTCIGCLGGCGRPCSINYDIQDDPIPLTTAESPKKVAIIGGGIAGMEAARIAAERGHQVTLLEKNARLGGMVAALAMNPITAEFGNVIDYLENQMGKLGVDVRVCREATVAAVRELKPDVTILATGSTAKTPEAAVGKPGVMSHAEASRNSRAIGQRVVVWGLVGAELAIKLAEEGREVVLVGRGGQRSLGSDLAGSRRWWLVRRLTDVNVPRARPETQQLSNPKVYFNTSVEDIGNGQITIKTADETSVLAYDTLVLSRRFGERSANDALFDELAGAVAEIHKIGDCADIKGIREAIWSANEVARNI